MRRKIKVLKTIPVWVIAVIVIAVVVGATGAIISNVWKSPKINVPAPVKLKLYFSLDDKDELTLPMGKWLEYEMTLENPDEIYTWHVDHVRVEIYDLSDKKISPDDIVVQYYDPEATPGYEWKTIEFKHGIKEDGTEFLYHNWADYGFDCQPGYKQTIKFRIMFKEPGQYYAEAWAVGELKTED